jgi:hypothetical protein
MDAVVLDHPKDPEAEEGSPSSGAKTATRGTATGGLKKSA